MITAQYHRSLRLGAILTELHVRLHEQRPVIGQPIAERMKRKVSITMPLGDWHLIKGAIADALNAIPEATLPPILVSAEPPKRRWWRAGPDRSQDIRGALAMLAGSGIGAVILIVALACTSWN